MRRNCFSATKRPEPTQRSRWSPPCQRFTFEQTLSTIENADSMILVLASDLRSCAVSFRWACVNQEKLAMRLPVMPVAYGLSWIESSRAGSLVGFAKGRRVMAARAGGVGGCGRAVATL